MLNDFSLDGKNALVTGGGSGLGKEIALVLAEAGADVAVAARRLTRIGETADAIRSLGKRAVAIQADVSDSKQVDDMVSEATSDLGRIDILVNNAGIKTKVGPVVSLPEAEGYSIQSDRMDDATWHEVLNINLSGSMYVCRAVAPQTLERRSGKIINISSTDAILAYANKSAYHVSKAGVITLTKVLASEWGQYNINVNAIGPGWFNTEMSEQRFNDPEWVERLVAELPLRRFTSLRDLGLLAVYLASPASDWMTGQIIYLDGGETAMHN